MKEEMNTGTEKKIILAGSITTILIRKWGLKYGKVKLKG